MEFVGELGAALVCVYTAIDRLLLRFEIKALGTKVEYRPEILMGGKNLEHDCGVDRSIGYFLEPLIVLGLFGKKPLSITLKGITNDSKDPSVDTFQSTTLPILKRFGIPEGLELKIESRGVPHGGGQVVLTVPIVKESLKAVTWTDMGMVKKISRVTFSTSAWFQNAVRDAARGIFNRLLPHVHLVTDHTAGKSPGYGISLVAETITGCLISADTAVSKGRGEEEGETEDAEKKELMTPEDVGEKIASVLLGEIEQGGVVDSTHQGLLFILCALCREDVSKIHVGKLSPYGIQTLRTIREILGVKFVIKPDPSTGNSRACVLWIGIEEFIQKGFVTSSGSRGVFRIRYVASGSSNADCGIACSIGLQF